MERGGAHNDGRHRNTGPIVSRNDEGGQAKGGNLGERVIDKDAKRRFNRRPYLQSLRAAMRWQKLDVQMPVGGTLGRLLDAHHVGKLEPEQRVITRDDVAQRLGKIERLIIGEIAEASTAVTSGAQMHFERPSCRVGDSNRERLICYDHALGGVVECAKAATKTGSLMVTRKVVAVELGLHRGWGVPERVKLTVRMAERGANALPPILKRHDVGEAFVPERR